MLITESKLRKIIRNLILESYSDLTPEEAAVQFSNKDLSKLISDCDLPSTDFRKSSHSSHLSLGDIVLCKGAIPKDEEYYNAKNEEDYYLVLGFIEEEFEDKSAGSSYTKSSIYKRDSELFDVVYLSDLGGEIYYFVLDEASEDNISLPLGKILK